jgi:hypothetical protein
LQVPASKLPHRLNSGVCGRFHAYDHVDAAHDDQRRACFSDLARSRFKYRVLGFMEMPSPSRARTARIGSDPFGPKMMGETVSCPAPSAIFAQAIFKFDWIPREAQSVNVLGELNAERALQQHARHAGAQEG